MINERRRKRYYNNSYYIIIIIMLFHLIDPHYPYGRVIQWMELDCIEYKHSSWKQSHNLNCRQTIQVRKTDYMSSIAFVHPSRRYRLCGCTILPDVDCSPSDLSVGAWRQPEWTIHSRYAQPIYYELGNDKKYINERPRSSIHTHTHTIKCLYQMYQQYERIMFSHSRNGILGTGTASAIGSCRLIRLGRWNDNSANISSIYSRLEMATIRHQSLIHPYAHNGLVSSITDKVIAQTSA